MVAEKCFKHVDFLIYKKVIFWKQVTLIVLASYFNGFEWLEMKLTIQRKCSNKPLKNLMTTTKTKGRSY